MSAANAAAKALADASLVAGVGVVGTACAMRLADRPKEKQQLKSIVENLSSIESNLAKIAAPAATDEKETSV